jgi:hypothetical protein
MRPMMAPMISARCGPLSPTCWSCSTNCTCAMAHSATDSTPTLRGRLSSSESTSTAWTSAARGAAGRRSLALARQQPGEQPLRFPFDGPRAGQQGTLAAAQFLQPRAQRRPLLRRQREMAAQVEQGDLPHPSAHALGLHQAVGGVAFPGGAVTGRRATDVHPSTLRYPAPVVSGPIEKLGTTLRSSAGVSIRIKWLDNTRG